MSEKKDERRERSVVAEEEARGSVPISPFCFYILSMQIFSLNFSLFFFFLFL